MKLGPTSAWEEDPGTVTYDATRWEATDADGAIALANLADRLTPCERLPTGVRGRVSAPGTITLT